MFIKRYPYLQDISFENAQQQLEKLNFLSKVDNFINQRKYLKLILLDWQERPIKEIQGDITGGTLTKDGSSTFRHSCSLTAVVNGEEYDVNDLNMNYSMNHKVYLEVGIKNETKFYPEYPILWFPQGLFLINSFTASSSTTTAININIQLKDKMALLSGDAGGKFPSAVVLDVQDSQLPTGEYVQEKIQIYRIIQEVVNHYGGEDLNNIIIEDVPLQIKRVMRWTGNTPLYLVPQNNNATAYLPQLDTPSDMTGVIVVKNSEDAGYILDDFVWTDELAANAGETVVSILDKIKQALGNYEYFYDAYGRFHFREIKNYLNTSQSSFLLNDMSTENDDVTLGTQDAYLVDVSFPKSEYTFSDNKNLISINVSPQYGNIKNDYIVHGQRKNTSSNLAMDIFYHLAIDKKPKLREHTDILLYLDPNTKNTRATKVLETNNVTELPDFGEFNTIYLLNKNQVFYWAEDNTWHELEFIAFKNSVTPKDWREELYYRGLETRALGLNANSNDWTASNSYWNARIQDNNDVQDVNAEYYFAELDAFFPTIYDLKEQKFYGQEEIYADSALLTNSIYFLDFIDSASSALGQYSVSNIGRRQDVVVNNDINCLFTPEIPPVIFINVDSDEDEVKAIKEKCAQEGWSYAQISGNWFEALDTGGRLNGAYDQIKYELYYHTNYATTLSMTAIPVYYLEPNVRISVNDKTTNTYGDFMVQNITIPLNVTGTMSITANQTTDRYE